MYDLEEVRVMLDFMVLNHFETRNLGRWSRNREFENHFSEEILCNRLPRLLFIWENGFLLSMKDSEIILIIN